jgi:hypothetical protein
VQKFKPDKHNGNIHEDQYIFLITSRSVLPEIRNVLDKFEEKIRKILCSIYCVFENPAVCKIRWKNEVQRGRPHMTIWRKVHCMLDTYCYSTLSVLSFMSSSVML